MRGLAGRVGIGAVSKEVGFIEYFDEGRPSFLVALMLGGRLRESGAWTPR